MDVLRGNREVHMDEYFDAWADITASATPEIDTHTHTHTEMEYPSTARMFERMVRVFVFFWGGRGGC